MDPDRKKKVKVMETLKDYVDLNEIKPHLEKSKIFTKNMLCDIYKGDTFLFEELPTRGPKAYDLFITVLKAAGYEAILQFLANSAINNNTKLYDANSCYQISAETVSYCLIIANQKYHDYENDQMHFEEACVLDEVFTKIGCSSQLKTDLSQESMFSTLQSFSCKDFSHADLCLVIIITHISNINSFTAVYGNDNKEIFEKEIINLFDSEHCPSLHKKPKIFFFLSDDDVETSQSLCTITSICMSDFLIIHLPVKSVKEFSFSKIFASVFKCFYNNTDFETIIKCAYDIYYKQLSKLGIHPQIAYKNGLQKKIYLYSKV